MANKEYSIIFEDKIGGKWRQTSSLSEGVNATDAIRRWKRARPWAKEVRKIRAKPRKSRRLIF